MVERRVRECDQAPQSDSMRRARKAWTLYNHRSQRRAPRCNLMPVLLSEITAEWSQAGDIRTIGENYNGVDVLSTEGEVLDAARSHAEGAEGASKARSRISIDQRERSWDEARYPAVDCPAESEICHRDLDVFPGVFLENIAQNVERYDMRNPASAEIKAFLLEIHSASDVSPTVKAYSDIVYYNYYALGLSLQFVPTNGYKPKTNATASEIETARLSLDAFDFYNVPPVDKEKAAGTSARRSELAFASYPAPITLRLAPSLTDKDGKLLERPEELVVTVATTGKEFVQALGEPDRKGGGVGPSTGSIGIWCEWPRDGVHVEFAGDGAKGPQAWERGKDALWKVVTVFRAESAK
ncbi:hypothetical protein CYLTODRAFT_442979 [Cylindrobasidium torrendii FP15055 ss-10]|uniref:Uncharacterized protein n=1 Tax=Cylindrobasidium torrendii FP15055 ss-10 TaxID=1314674 RepID=A0A0D7BES3_9AGAR|nr:hypothetical protein CYLTODRAFT_442979 [Cylindrobasidium torrendii FP15055 ss-10]